MVGVCDAMLIVIHFQVRMTVKDGTRLLVGNLHIIADSYNNPNGNERHQIPDKPAAALHFKEQAMRNALDQMLVSAA